MVEVEYLINLGFVVLQVYGLLSLLAFVPAMIDVLKSKKSTKYKLVWLAIFLILGIIGVLVYFLVERKMLRFRR
jgi:uncharacterized protein with PQ loop repeat